MKNVINLKETFLPFSVVIYEECRKQVSRRRHKQYTYFKRFKSEPREWGDWDSTYICTSSSLGSWVDFVFIPNREAQGSLWFRSHFRLSVVYGKRLHISDCQHFCPRSDKAAKSWRKVEKINKHKIELDYTHRKVFHFLRKPSKISPPSGKAGRSAGHYFDDTMMEKRENP